MIGEIQINGIYNEIISTYDNEMAVYLQLISGTPTSKKPPPFSSKPRWNEELKSL